MYLLMPVFAVYYVWGIGEGYWQDFDSINTLTFRFYVVGRAVNALLGTLTILLVYLLARKLCLIVDSTGLSIVGEGEWAAAKHGGRGRCGWRKLHLGVDGSRVIVACALTEPTADDAITGISLVDEVDGHLTRVTADPAYDTLAFYGAAGARGARVVVPPTKTASLSRRGARSGARDRTIRRVKALGRRRWKKASGYHQQARVENAFFRYMSIVGDCLRARSSSGQRREAVLACNVLNRMTELGRPVSYRIGR